MAPFLGIVYDCGNTALVKMYSFHYPFPKRHICSDFIYNMCNVNTFVLIYTKGQAKWSKWQLAAATLFLQLWASMEERSYKNLSEANGNKPDLLL